MVLYYGVGRKREWPKSKRSSSKYWRKYDNRSYDIRVFGSQPMCSQWGSARTSWGLEESEGDLSQSAPHQNTKEKYGNRSYGIRVFGSQPMCSHWDNDGNKKFWEEISFPWMRHVPHIKRRAQQFFYCCVLIVAAATILPSRCLAMIGGIYIHKDWWEALTKYAVQMGSCAMIYLPNFIKIGSVIQKLIHRHSQEGDRISLVRESRLLTITMKMLHLVGTNDRRTVIILTQRAMTWHL
jgi:hypothetical protein